MSLIDRAVSDNHILRWKDKSMPQRLPIEKLRYNGRQDAVIDFRAEAREPRETEFVHGTIVVRTDVGDYEFCFMRLEGHFCVDVVLNRSGDGPKASDPIGVMGMDEGRQFGLALHKGGEYTQPTAFGWPAARTIALLADLP